MQLQQEESRESVTGGITLKHMQEWFGEITGKHRALSSGDHKSNRKKVEQSKTQWLVAKATCTRCQRGTATQLPASKLNCSNQRDDEGDGSSQNDACPAPLWT